jgi:hypothetical protein
MQPLRHRATFKKASAAIIRTTIVLSALDLQRFWMGTSVNLLVLIVSLSTRSWRMRAMKIVVVRRQDDAGTSIQSFDILPTITE